jgi:hypothetical protein
MHTATQTAAAATARRKMYDSKAFEAQYHTSFFYLHSGYLSGSQLCLFALILLSSREKYAGKKKLSPASQVTSV